MWKVNFLYKESKSNKNIWRLGGEGVGVWLGVAWVSDFVFLFSKESKSEKKMSSF